MQSKKLSPGDIVITDDKPYRPSVWGVMEGDRPVGNALISEIASNKKMLVISHAHPHHVYVLFDEMLGYINVIRVSKVL